MDELEKYWSRNLIEQSDWIQGRLQANPAGTNQVEALARFHLELALTIVEGYLAYGGHPNGLKPAIRISLTLYEMHRRRSGLDQPEAGGPTGLRLTEPEQMLSKQAQPRELRKGVTR